MSEDWKGDLQPVPESKRTNPRYKRGKITPNFDKKYDWTITEEDMKRGDEILLGEYIPVINKQTALESLIFCQLAQRERYDKQVLVFGILKDAKLLEPENILNEEKRWLQILRMKSSLYKQKYRNIRCAAEFWQNTDHSDRLMNDIENDRKNGEELRDELVKNVNGVGYKTGSLHFIKLGYQYFASFDVWLARYMEDLGLDDIVGFDLRKEDGVVPDRHYKNMEKEFGKVAESYGRTLAEHTADVWGKYSKWSHKARESYVRTVANNIKCDITDFK